MQMKGQTRYQMSQQGTILQKEENIGGYSQRYRREASPIEREVEVDISINYTSSRPGEGLMISAISALIRAPK